MSASCVIGTFGDRTRWEAFAARATASAYKQRFPFDQVIWSHADTLQHARNDGANDATSEWLVFLDADDELDTLYLKSMLEAKGDIRRPATLGIVDGVEDDEPVMITRADLRVRNFIVIGAMIRREAFLRVGGFSDDPILEDWDLWIRLYLDGAEIVDVPEAVYRVHVRPQSRNSFERLHGSVYSEIKNRYRDRWNSVKPAA